MIQSELFSWTQVAIVLNPFHPPSYIQLFYFGRTTHKTQIWRDNVSYHNGPMSQIGPLYYRLVGVVSSPLPFSLFYYLHTHTHTYKLGPYGLILDPYVFVSVSPCVI